MPKKDHFVNYLTMSQPKSKPKQEREKRESYLQHTLRHIREKRLSYDAAHKGLFPDRTPSRLLSPIQVTSEKHEEKKEPIFNPDRPTLSLTKLDFELLREWDWKERQKRLETWGQELGITKQHRHFNKRASNVHAEQDDDSLYQRKQKNMSDKERMDKKSKPGTSKAILKRELEHLTGLNVYAPGDKSRASKAKRRSILKNSGTRSFSQSFSTASPSRRRHSDSGVTTPSRHPSLDDIMDVVNSHHRHRHHHHHHHSHHSQAPSSMSSKRRGNSIVPSQDRNRSGLQNTLESRQRHLDKMKREASAASTKKTFGKGGWSAGGSSKLRTFTPSAPNISASPQPTARGSGGGKEKRHSNELQLAESQATMTSGVSRGSSVSSRQRPHHRHHPPSSSADTSAMGASHSTHHHHGPHFSHSRTDLEEEQPSTSYTSHGGHSYHTSYKSTRATSRRSSSPSTPSDNAPTVGVTDLFRGIHQSVDEHDKDQDDDEADSPPEEKKEKKRYERPEQPTEFQDACFGGIRFVDRAAVKPVSKVNKGYEFYMNFDDEELGLGMGRSQQLKVKFFKNTGTEQGRSKKMLDKKAAEKAKKQQEKEEAEKEAAAKKSLAEQKEKEEAEEAKKESEEPQVVKTWQELVQTDLINFSEDNRKSKRERLADLEKALMKLPGISSRWRVEVSQASGRASTHDINAVSRIPKRAQFTRPPRRIWYTPLPLTIKKYYRTNWKKIRFDIRQLMKGKKFWPKLWINFEESHPKKLFELIQAKLAVKDFDKHGFKRVYDWGRGIHPDYIDWILEDIVPHPGKYYYPRKDESEEASANDEVVRRASVEETDFRLKEWFVKPPRYIPDTPLSPPFDQADFCGYGDREKPFFLAFTLPREILHYYAPPSNIQKFFRNIPKPPYAFPGYTFKRWLNYPLDQKLPQYYPFPKRFMIWTRGKVGESLQCHSNVFYNDDPHIQKRDVEYCPYHDPHARSYILRREILDRIWELGIINSKGEVKCSMQQFNKNRQILRDYEWLEEATKRWDLKWNDRQHQNKLTKHTNYDDYDWETKKKDRMIRLQRCKTFVRIRDTEDKKKFQMMMAKTARLMEEAESKREREREEMIARAREKKREHVKKKKMVVRAEILRVLQLQAIQEQKDRNAQRQRRRRHLEQMEEQMGRRRSSWVRHAEFNRRKIEHVRRMEIELENEMKMRTQMHKRKVRREWADIRKIFLENGIFLVGMSIYLIYEILNCFF